MGRFSALSICHLVGLFLLTTSACSWNDAQHIETAVFSDDDTMHLYVVSAIDERRDLRFENQRQTRNPRHQLMVQNVDGSERPALTELRPHAVERPIFLMKDEGYVMVEVFDQEDTAQERWLEVTSLGGRALASQSVPIDPALMCSGRSIVPSPSGELIAFVKQNGNPMNQALCSGVPVEVEFFAPATLNVISRYTWPMVGDWSPMVVWTEAGTLVVRTGADRSTSITEVDPDSGPRPSDDDGCYYPSTTSGVTRLRVLRLVQAQLTANRHIL